MARLGENKDIGMNTVTIALSFIREFWNISTLNIVEEK
jgi:hypothetical protein